VVDCLVIAADVAACVGCEVTVDAAVVSVIDTLDVGHGCWQVACAAGRQSS
jgi:hypothetical protein